MEIKGLQALHHAPPLHLHQVSAITLSKIKCVLHVILRPFKFLQGFKKISKMVFKLQKGHTYMTWNTINNVQRVVTPKTNNSE